MKKIMLLLFSFHQSPPDAGFASSGGHTVSLPAARGNASVRFILEFVVIQAKSVVIILRVVVGRLRPSTVASGW